MKKIVLYGAGKRGRLIYDFLKANNYDDFIDGFCDEKAEELKFVNGKKVTPPQGLDDSGEFVYCLTPVDDKIREQMKDKLQGKKHIEFNELAHYLSADPVKFNREFCAYAHLENMNHYFEEAENTLEIFWSPNSTFYKMFQRLDLTNVIELACGRGRHVTKYIDLAGQITVVDILEKNIEICQERFKDISKISYYKNDGYNLRKLKDNQYSALFTYDAMVHFELIDIYEYLKDIHRVLKSGGRALFHHSNNTESCKASFADATHGRNFMSKEIFAYLADRTGFKILEQTEIDWEIANLDCVSLVEKI